MPQDLYETLGVDPDADDGAIRKAYRSRAKGAHPDTGGTQEEFENVQTAHLVLLDPVRRAQYDATGQWDDLDPNDPEHGAITLIAQMLAGIVRGDQDPSTVDLQPHIRKCFETNIDGMRKAIAAMEKAHRRTKKLQGRFKHRQNKHNRLSALLDGQLRQLQSQIAVMEVNIKDHHLALEILAEYDFEQEKPQRSSGLIHRFGSTIGSTSSTTAWG